MHPIILPIFVIIFVLGLLIYGIWYDDDDYIACSFIGIIPIALTMLISCVGYWQTKEYPVEYTTESITSKIFIHTKYGEYESDKKVDFDNWTKNYHGIIVQECNGWGYVLRDKFTVKIP